MIEEIGDIAPSSLAAYDAVIDVRSPGEFAEDHIPGAINLSVLDDRERAEIGTIYVQDSRFRARRLGAALVARNVAHHLETTLADKDAKFRPLLYCWRGGMRSHAMATILSQIGWRVGVVVGGWKTWRRAVVASLAESDAPLNLILIDGQTGTAKTDILKRMETIGVQTIDLEGLAAHRGSVFGDDPLSPQPTQKFFESLLFDRLSRLDLSAPIAVEAESANIGRLTVPKRLWAAMRAAPRIVLSANTEKRAQYLVGAYADLVATPGRIQSAIDRLRAFHAKETIEAWLALADPGDYAALSGALMREHYDPLYDRSRKRSAEPVASIRLGGFAPHDLDRAAEVAAAIVRRLARRSPLSSAPSLPATPSPPRP